MNAIELKTSNFKEEIKTVLEKCKHNKLKIVVALFIAVFLACFYLYLRTPKYTVVASVTLNEDSSGEGNLLKQFSIGSMLGGSSSIYNEQEALASHTTMMRVMKKLGLNVTYYEKIGFLKKRQVYPTPKIAVQATNDIADTLSIAITFKIKAEKGGIATISSKAEGKKLGTVHGKLPLEFTTPYGTFEFAYTADSLKNQSITETVDYYGYSMAAENYLEIVKFGMPVKLADVVNLTYEGGSKALGIALLYAIIDEYNSRGIEFERARAERQLYFINDRILSLTKELAESEKEVKDFKERNKVSDINADVEYIMGQKAGLESNILSLKTENEIIGSAIAFLKNPSNEYTTLPSLVTSYDAPIENYNNLLLYRMKLARSARPGNESLDQLDKQIAITREHILAVFERQKDNLDLRLSELTNKLASINSRLGKVPGQENIYRDIYRDQSIKERLYIYLLEQREEAALTMLNTQARGKTVNEPYVVTTIKVRPAWFWIFVAGFIGLFFFPALWYMKLLLNGYK